MRWAMLTAPLLFLLGLDGHPCSLAQEAAALQPTRSPFRYVILSRSLDTSLALDVLLEERAFTEANLKELFTLLKKRFPKPQILIT